MKTPMKGISIEELQEKYNRISVRQEGEGYCLSKVGHTGYTTHPDLRIHVPYMGIPTLNGSPIDLLHGYGDMHDLIEIMGLEPNHRTAFLFCKNLHIKRESGKKIANITLCDPEEAEHILIIANFADGYHIFHSEKAKDAFFYYGDLWHSYSYYSDGGLYTERRMYSLVPIGFCDPPTEERQSPEDMEKIKYEIIYLANRYLRIENELETEGTEESDYEEPQTQEETKNTGLGLVVEIYRDDIYAKDCWAIDAFGRLLQPEITPLKGYTGSVEVAETHAWDYFPSNTLVISWEKLNTVSQHHFKIVKRPDDISYSQLERVARIEQEIEKVYADRRSAYDTRTSPGIGEGWGFWKHVSGD